MCCHFCFPTSRVSVGLMLLPGVSAGAVVGVQESLQLLASERVLAGNVTAWPHQFGLKLGGIFGQCTEDKAEHVGSLWFEQLHQQRNWQISLYEEKN